MPKVNVVKSINIQAEPNRVFHVLSDFNQWSAWSPWLIQDPTVKVDVAADAKYYSWEGKRAGSGNMRIVNEQSYSQIDYDLVFLKPWKSTAKVKFTLEPESTGTKVSWHMDSSLPFFMFWMKNMMITFIGMDYDRGLNMLKDYTEDGEVHSKLNFLGRSENPGFQFIGIKRSVTMKEMPSYMEKDLTSLKTFFNDKQEHISGVPFSIYYKWDMKKGTSEYAVGFPVTGSIENLPNEFFEGSIPPSKIYTIEHVGQYRHLGNAWTTIHAMQRGKEIQPIKGMYPYETYVNNPDEVNENDLITRINFPVKS